MGFWKRVIKKWHYWTLTVLLSLFLLMVNSSSSSRLNAKSIWELVGYDIGNFVISGLIVAFFYWISYKYNK